MARKGTNLARMGKYSSTLTGRLRARACSNHYSLVRPWFPEIFSFNLNALSLVVSSCYKVSDMYILGDRFCFVFTLPV